MCKIQRSIDTIKYLQYEDPDTLISFPNQQIPYALSTARLTCLSNKYRIYT